MVHLLTKYTMSILWFVDPVPHLSPSSLSALFLPRPLPVHTANSINLDPTDHAPSSPLPLSGHRLLSRLRKGAFLLYQSQPLGIVITRLEVSPLITCHPSLSLLPPTSTNSLPPFLFFSYPFLSSPSLSLSSVFLPSSLTHPHTHSLILSPLRLLLPLSLALSLTHPLHSQH